MSLPTFTHNQLNTMALLGYMRWLPRAELKHYQAFEAEHEFEDKTENKTETKKVPLQEDKRDLTDDTSLSTTTDNGSPAQDIELSSSEIRHSTLSSEHVTVIDELNLVTAQSITLVSWHDDKTDKLISVALPPLWGVDSHLQLFANPVELAFLLNALKVCGLTTMADNIRRVDEHCAQHTVKLMQHDIGELATMIEPSGLILLLNDTLPIMQSLQAKLLKSRHKNVLSIAHPYQCIEQPNEKAALWQQLLTVKSRLDHD